MTNVRILVILCCVSLQWSASGIRFKKRKSETVNFLEMQTKVTGKPQNERFFEKGTNVFDMSGMATATLYHRDIKVKADKCHEFLKDHSCVSAPKEKDAQKSCAQCAQTLGAMVQEHIHDEAFGENGFMNLHWVPWKDEDENDDEDEDEAPKGRLSSSAHAHSHSLGKIEYNMLTKPVKKKGHKPTLHKGRNLIGTYDKWWGPKKFPRIQSKVKTKYHGKVAMVTDAARFNLPFKDAHTLIATMRDIFERQKNKFKVVVMKNRWTRPDWSKMDDENWEDKDNGMLDSLVNFEFLEGHFKGYIFEVQFQVAGLLSAKHKEHAVYKIRRAMCDEVVPKEGDTDEQILAKISEFKRIAPVVTDGKTDPQEAYDAGDEAKQGLMKVLFSLSQEPKYNKEMANHGFSFKTKKFETKEGEPARGIALLKFKSDEKGAKQKLVTAEDYLEEGKGKKEYVIANVLKKTLNIISKELYGAVGQSYFDRVGSALLKATKPLKKKYLKS